MLIPIGTRCRVVNAYVQKNNGVVVIVVGDAGIRHVKVFGKTQCYFIDRELETTGGERRNWTSHMQLEPIDDLADKPTLLARKPVSV